MTIRISKSDDRQGQHQHQHQSDARADAVSPFQPSKDWSKAGVQVPRQGEASGSRPWCLVCGERAHPGGGSTLRLMRRRVPRAVGLVAQAAAIPAFFVGVPLELSRLGERHGWSDGKPGAANPCRCASLGAGAALLVWAMTGHYRAAPQGWDIRLAPDYLLEGGPYRFSRNPMYVGEATIWAGWTVLFGSVPVAGGLVMLTAIQAAAVRLEERALHKRWATPTTPTGSRFPDGSGCRLAPGCGQADSEASNLGRGS
jgi:protein-S-isoprenylcysteine O-methyltransferase Ste14